MASRTPVRTPLKPSTKKATLKKKAAPEKATAKKATTKKATTKKPTTRTAEKTSWTLAALATLESKLKAMKVDELRAFLDGMTIRLDRQHHGLVGTLYNLGIAQMARPAVAYWLSERLTREKLPSKRDLPRRHLYLLALSNGLYASLQMNDTGLGLRIVSRVKKLGSELPSMLHNVACVLARAGQDDAAVAAIDEAVTAGYQSVHLLVADDDLVRLMERDDVRAILARRSTAAEDRVQERLETLQPHFATLGGVPPDVERVWRMLLGEDARLRPRPDAFGLHFATMGVILVDDSGDVALPRPLQDGVVPVLFIDDLLVLAALHDGQVAFVAVADDGAPRFADRSIGGLLATLTATAHERAFVTHLFKEYAPAAGPAPTPFEAIEAIDVVVFAAGAGAR